MQPPSEIKAKQAGYEQVQNADGRVIRTKLPKGPRASAAEVLRAEVQGIGATDERQYVIELVRMAGVQAVSRFRACYQG